MGDPLRRAMRRLWYLVLTFGIAVIACSEPTSALPRTPTSVRQSTPSTVRTSTLARSSASTPTRTPTRTQTVVATLGSSDCVLDAAFVRDVTVPDGTAMLAGEQFAKTWEIRNTGTCAWDDGFRLQSVGDTVLEGDAHANLAEVAPGEGVAVTVNLVTPREPGRYRSEWQVCTDDQLCFGTLFWVEIVSLGIPTSTSRPSATLNPTAPPQQAAPVRACCKYCCNSKPCGDSCISLRYTCHKPPGCACSGCR